MPEIKRTSLERIQELVIETFGRLPETFAEVTAAETMMRQRLKTGEGVIGAKQLAGENTNALEDFWIELLHSRDWLEDQLNVYRIRELQDRLSA